MDKKITKLSIIIDPQEKKMLEDYADKYDTTVSQLVRKMIRSFLAGQIKKKEKSFK